MKVKGTQKRGFAVMAPARVREIAAKGGKRAHELGRAHEWTPDEAQAAGRIGGKLKGPRRPVEELAAEAIQAIRHFCPDYFTSARHNVNDCPACQAMNAPERLPIREVIVR